MDEIFYLCTNNLTMDTLFQVLKLLGSLGLFLYGMTLMSEGLQKVAGDKMRSILAAMTSTSLKRILTGLFHYLNHPVIQRDHCNGGQFC